MGNHSVVNSMVLKFSTTLDGRRAPGSCCLCIRRPVPASEECRPSRDRMSEVRLTWPSSEQCSHVWARSSGFCSRSSWGASFWRTRLRFFSAKALILKQTLGGHVILARHNWRPLAPPALAIATFGQPALRSVRNGGGNGSRRLNSTTSRQRRHCCLKQSPSRQHRAWADRELGIVSDERPGRAALRRLREGGSPQPYTGPAWRSIRMIPSSADRAMKVVIRFTACLINR